MHIELARSGFVYVRIYILVHLYSLSKPFDMICVEYKGAN